MEEAGAETEPGSTPASANTARLPLLWPLYQTVPSPAALTADVCHVTVPWVTGSVDVAASPVAGGTHKATVKVWASLCSSLEAVRGIQV